MTPQEINTAISEYCDGRCCRQNEEWEWVWNHPGGLFQGFSPYSDLNAMHEALTLHLSKVCGTEKEKPFSTASQRAEAFLRAIGKWKE